MSNEETLHVYFDPKLGDGSADSAQFLASQNNSISLLESENLAVSAQKLLEDEGDLLLSSAEWIIANPNHGLTVLGSLPRREPTMVLVSNDKLEYLPKGAIIISEHELCRRQLIRARPDLVVHTAETISEKVGEQLNFDNKVELYSWLENKRLEGEIDGFITSRTLFDAAKIKSRRHTLGLQRGESGRHRFLPPPWQGFTLVMAKPGSKIWQLKDYISEQLDYTALLAFNLESRIIRDIDKEILPFIGIHVCLRQIGTVLRELGDEEDLQLKEELLDAYGKPRSTKPRVELMLELLNSDGSVSISVERVSPEEEGMEAAVRLIQTFTDLLEIATMEHEASPRLGEARPPLMNLGE